MSAAPKVQLVILLWRYLDSHALLKDGQTCDCPICRETWALLSTIAWANQVRGR